MNDTEENDNNDDDGEWEDMPNEDMENMEENWKNMKKTNYMGKKTEKYRAKFSVFHEFTNFSLFITTMGSGTICRMGIHKNSQIIHQACYSLIILTMGKNWKI